MRISDWSSDVCSSDLAKGRPIKVDGRYLASWNAYPQPGMEEGPAVIGLAWSDDLIRWHRDDTPILRPEDGAEWERAGLYGSELILHGDIYYLFYNSKNHDPQDRKSTRMNFSHYYAHRMTSAA